MNAIMEMFDTGTAVWTMVDYLFKLTLILGLGCILYRAISRFPAGSKIQLWKLTFAVVFLLPLLFVLLPSYSVPVISGSLRQPGQLEAQTAVQEVATTDDSEAGTTGNEGTSAEQTASPGGNTIQHGQSIFTARNLAVSLLAVWISGFLLHLWRMGRQLMIGSRMRARAELLSSQEHDAYLSELTSKTGSNYQTSVYVSAEITTPIAVGFFNPAVILPAESKDWSEQKRKSVIVHEFAHIQNLDIVIRFFALFICSLYWFHPLAWLGFNKLKEEQEKRADSAVITQGVLATSYADHLMEIVRSAQSLSGQKGILANMGGYKSLPERLNSLLNGKQGLLKLSRFQNNCLIGLAGSVMLVSACVSLQPVAAAQDTDAETAANQPRVPANRNRVVRSSSPSADYQALEFAIESNSEDRLELTLESLLRNDDPAVFIDLFEDGYLLNLAMQSDREDIIELALEAIVSTGDKRLASSLLEDGSLLTAAMQTNKEDILELILEFTAWTENAELMRDQLVDGVVLNMAMDSNMEDILELILEAIAWTEDQALMSTLLADGTILHKALDANTEDIIELVLEAIVWSEDRELASSLLEDGTVLQKAIDTKEEDIVELIMELNVWSEGR